ncbi:MAG TPA: glycine cleavage system protein R, partial [Pseudomonas sp.]|nr:glycine cleavage system protein R [Pseudomonas sp.]
MYTPLVPREHYLVISALGPNPMDLTNVLCRAANEHRCALASTRLPPHGECSAQALSVA